VTRWLEGHRSTTSRRLSSGVPWCTHRRGVGHATDGHDFSHSGWLYRGPGLHVIGMLLPHDRWNGPTLRRPWSTSVRTAALRGIGLAGAVPDPQNPSLTTGPLSQRPCQVEVELAPEARERDWGQVEVVTAMGSDWRPLKVKVGRRIGVPANSRWANRRKRPEIATWASIRAKVAPRQWWMPPPKAR
jgi:hypothetical protein